MARAAIAVRYLFQIPAKERAWCVDCPTGTAATLGTLARAYPRPARPGNRLARSADGYLDRANSGSV